jgi:hypothetical protein
VASFALTGSPTFAVFIADDRILVPMQGPPGVALIDTIVARVPVGVYPDRLALRAP